MLPVAFLLEVFGGDETQGGAVDAVALTRGHGTIGEEVPEMAVAFRAAHFARAYAATGVDFLAVGALTHSAPVLDIGADLRPVEG